MSGSRRSTEKVERTPEEQAELRAERERFSRERPSLDDLVGHGEVDGPYQQGDLLDLLAILARLRAIRLARGLSLTDVATASGIHKPALSLLEGGKNLNPTLDTLRRYAAAVGARIDCTVSEVEPTPGSVS